MEPGTFYIPPVKGKIIFFKVDRDVRAERA